MMYRLILVAAISAALMACGGQKSASVPADAVKGTGALSEDGVNLEVWLERLEVGSRELYSAREKVVAAVGVKEGDWIADIGAGTGLYSLLFAEAVGAKGRVFAEDIEPLFLDLINQRTSDLRLSNVTAVLGREDHITLPDETLDFVFIADTYHYFTDRESVMRSVYDALKPGGALILVEFDVVPGEARPDYKSHVRFGKASVISEIEYIGFDHVKTPNVEGLTENYFLRFTKPE